MANSMQKSAKDLEHFVSINMFDTEVKIAFDAMTGEYNLVFTVKIKDRKIRFYKTVKNIPFEQKELGAFLQMLSNEFNDSFYECVDWEKVLKKFPVLPHE